jgi:hypothetical protein
MGLKEVEYMGVDWIELSHVRFKGWGSEPLCFIKYGEFADKLKTVSF